MTLGTVLELGNRPTPPWVFPAVLVREDLSVLAKVVYPPYLYRAKFLELRFNYSNFRLVFTDGSKTDEGVSCAVYREGAPISWCSRRTVYTVELYAIWHALGMIQDDGSSVYLFCTDSLRAVTAVHDRFSVDLLVVLLLEK